MKTLKKLSALLLAFILVFSLCACTGKSENPGNEPESASDEERQVKTKVAALNDLTGIGLAKVKTDRDYAYDVTYHNDSGEIVSMLTKGEVDIAALPLDLAAKLYNETNGGIKILSVNALGILHVLEKGKTIKSVADLKGKKIYASGQGDTPEYVINYVLGENGIDPESDVTVEYKGTDDEITALATEGNADVVILPEPFASKVIKAGKGFREALDLTKEWSKINDTQSAMGCIVARSEYIDANPDIISEFMTFNEVSLNYMSSSPDAPVILYEIGMIEKTDVELYVDVIPRCHMEFIAGEEMKAAVEATLKVLFDADPDSVGGEIPDEKIYYM